MTLSLSGSSVSQPFFNEETSILDEEKGFDTHVTRYTLRPAETMSESFQKTRTAFSHGLSMASRVFQGRNVYLKGSTFCLREQLDLQDRFIQELFQVSDGVNLPGVPMAFSSSENTQEFLQNKSMKRLLKKAKENRVSLLEMRLSTCVPGKLFGCEPHVVSLLIDLKNKKLCVVDTKGTHPKNLFFFCFRRLDYSVANCVQDIKNELFKGKDIKVLVSPHLQQSGDCSAASEAVVREFVFNRLKSKEAPSDFDEKDSLEFEVIENEEFAVACNNVVQNYALVDEIRRQMEDLETKN